MNKIHFIWGSYLFGAGFIACLAWVLIVSHRRVQPRHLRAVRLTGWFCGLLCVVAVFWPIFASSLAAAKMAGRHVILKEWYSALLQYSSDNVDRLPPAENWHARCEPYWSHLNAPTLRDPVEGFDPGVAFNVNCSGLSLEELDSHLILLAIGHPFDAALSDGAFQTERRVLVITVEGRVTSTKATDVVWKSE